jgi:hypothetical protein
LIKLVQLKENADGQETGGKIRSLLIPREYTRLDEMVDVMFTTAKDVESVVQAAISEEEEAEQAGAGAGAAAAAAAAAAAEKIKGTWQFTDSKALQTKREEIIAALSRREGLPLLKKSRALYWSADHDKRAACTISKSLTRNDTPRINDLFVTPAKAGVHGKRLNSDPWIPACAGMTR